MTDQPPRLTLEDLKKPGALPEKEVTLKSHAGSVLVRGFTRGEFNRIRQAAARNGSVDDLDDEKLEFLLFSRGVADPHLTDDEARAVLETLSVDDVSLVIGAVNEVNGWTPEFARETAVNFREES